MKKRGQVWVETVLYTLIGLTLIGLALGFIMPKINSMRDKIVIEQAINSLSELDAKIGDIIEKGPGNIRQVELLMKRGELYINSSSNEINMVLVNLAKPYSEPGVEISVGRVFVKSEVGQKTSSVYLRTKYLADITYQSKDEIKKFSSATTPYKIIIENKGSSRGTIWIDISEISNR